MQAITIRNAADLHKNKKIIVGTLYPIFIKTCSVLLYYIVGTIFYSHVEGWSIGDCFYFITVTGDNIVNKIDR